MKVALCQIDPVIGDFAGNVSKIVAAADRAHRHGARLAIFPELAIPGYPPLDLLEKRTFRAANERALDDLAARCPRGIAILVGCLAENPERARGAKPLYNAAALVHAGRRQIVARKCLLPTYDVFDERRYFEPGPDPIRNLLKFEGVRFGVTICEDIWNDKSFWNDRLYPIDPVEELVGAGARAIINISASPWSQGKEAVRYRMLRNSAERHGVPILFVNQVGAQTGLIFDGGSLAISPAGGRLAFPPVYFEERVEVVDLEALCASGAALVEPEAQDRIAMVHRALTLGIRSYFAKQGFERAVIGLSGGIDSSVTACLAAGALGAENVVGLSMPSRYSSEGSRTDAAALARNLGIALETIPIAPMFDAYRAALAPLFEGRPEDVTEENLQARIRGALLMAYSNKFGHLVLATGNKSECSMGFATLYGDTCGGLAVLADVWKTDVYELARFLNRSGEKIPASVLSKPPSPELRPGHLTSDSLPPFAVLDPVLRVLVEEEAGPEEAAEKTGAPIELCRDIQRRLYRAEYKRQQFPPALRVSRRAWVGRQYPIVQRFED
jgi:NAD+ synthetase